MTHSCSKVHFSNDAAVALGNFRDRGLSENPLSGGAIESEDISRNKKSFKLYLFILLIPIIRNIFFIRQRNDFAAVDIFALVDLSAIILMGAIVLGQGILFSSKWPQKFLGHLIVYYLFASMSFLWALPGNNLVYIVFRAVSMLIYLYYSEWLLHFFKNPQDAYVFIMRIGLFIVLGEIIYALRIGDLHTNSYTLTGGIVASMALTAWHLRLLPFAKIKYYVIIGTIAVILGTSGGSNIAFVVAILSVFCISKTGISWFRIIRISLLLYLLYIFAYTDIMTLLFPSKSIENIENASGRMAIWEFYIDLWRTHGLWLGLGFPIGERCGSMLGFLMHTTSVHNGFLSVAVNTGIIGCAIFLNFLFSLFFFLNKHTKGHNRWCGALIPPLIMIMINNLSFPALGSTWNTTTVPLFFIFAFLIRFCSTAYEE